METQFHANSIHSKSELGLEHRHERATLCKDAKCHLTLTYGPIEFEYILKYLDKSQAGESQIYAARLDQWNKLS
jgi:hypothetical protein